MSSLDRDYFDRLYAASDDPWSFATSAYEREKYDRTLAILDRARYARVLEIGCSIGVFTARLAARGDTLLAVDLSEAALARARERCASLPGVTFANLCVPSEFPAGPFDLIVLSEVGYYWSDGDFARALDRIVAALAPGGRLLLAHFLPKVDEYVRDGDAVHDLVLADPRLRGLRSERAERYRLDLLGLAPGP